MNFLPNADILSENAVNIASLVTAAEAPLISSILPGTGVMPMKDFMSGSVDILYYGPLKIGTPAQTLTIDIDTGSADLWVPVNCPYCANSQLDASRSSTYRDTEDEFSISYVSHKRACVTTRIANWENPIHRALGMLTEPWRQTLFLLVASVCKSKYSELSHRRRMTSMVFRMMGCWAWGSAPSQDQSNLLFSKD